MTTPAVVALVARGTVPVTFAPVKLVRADPFPMKNPAFTVPFKSS